MTPETILILGAGGTALAGAADFGVRFVREYVNERNELKAAAAAANSIKENRAAAWGKAEAQLVVWREQNGQPVDR